MQRAYSFFEAKSFDDDKREIQGIATTPTTDRYGDIVEPEGAQFALPLPLLWQHYPEKPVGHVMTAKPNKNGIPVTVRIEKTDEPGTLKDRLDEAWQSVKLKLVRAFSIGFQPIEYVQIEGKYAYRFTKWDWLELSLVTIPANADCNITTIKSIVERERAALGHKLKSGVKLIQRATPPAAIRPGVKLVLPAGVSAASQIKQ